MAADFQMCERGHRQFAQAHTPCAWCAAVVDGTVTAADAVLLSQGQAGTQGPRVTDAGLRLDDLAMVALSLNTVSLTDSAVAYAEMGFPVFPLVEGGKVPHPVMDKMAKDRGVPDGQRGLHLAHSDPVKVERWWRDYPTSNIGVRTGVVFSALDVDSKNGAPGWESVRRVRHLLGGAFAQVATPTGGGHLYAAPDAEGNHAAGNAGHGLDFRGVGGYLVAPPSVTEQGRYEWVSVMPDRFGEPLSWQAITDVLVPKPERVPFTPKPGHSPRLDGLVRTVAESQVGGRNAALHWAACRCVADGLDPFELLPAALSVGLSEFESKRTIESAVRSAS